MPLAAFGWVFGQALAMLSVCALIPIYIPLAAVSYVSWTALRGREKGW